MDNINLEIPVSSPNNEAQQNTNIESARKSYVRLTKDKYDIITNMLSARSNPAQIAHAIQISKRSAYRWIEAIEKGVVFSEGKPGPKPEDDTMRRCEIEAILASDNSLTARGLADRLPEEHKCSKSTLSRTIAKMGYTRKRLKTIVASKNSERVINERHVYSLRMSNILDEALIFIDETGFNLHVSAGYGYSPRGSTPYITVPTQRGRNLSLIAAVGVNGLIAHRSVIGSFNAERMVQWCNDALLPTLGGRRVTFVMDNARFHHVESVTSVLSCNGSTVQFLPPYSPQLNPIEEVFSQIKSGYRAHRPRPTNTEEMQAIISLVLDGLRDQSMSSYYRNMREWIVKAQQRLEFI